MKMLLLVLAAVSGQTSQQFDLDCTFTKAPKIKGMPAGEHYRIDLLQGRWCVGACSETKSFAEVSATKLVLQKVEPAYRGGEEHLLQIDRSTGAYFSFNRWDMGPRLGSTPSSVVEGTCQPASFSGFPDRPTKF